MFRAALLITLALTPALASADDKPAPTPATSPDPAPTPTPTTDAAPDGSPPSTANKPTDDANDQKAGTKPNKPEAADPVGTHGPWYQGPYAHNRFLHMSVTGAIGLYLLADKLFGLTPNPSSCRWCSVPSFDRGARDALVWSNRSTPDTISSVIVYGVAPIVGLTLLIASDKNASATRLIDDVLPVAETVAITQLVTGFAKYAFARERPYLHFSDATHPATPGADSFQSFWSGHSSAGFALITSVGYMCHVRRYWTEPYVWAAGITLAVATEYFRIAADKHYLSDVLVGGFAGIAAGVLVPRLMARDIKILPMPNGVQAIAAF